MGPGLGDGALGGAHQRVGLPVYFCDPRAPWQSVGRKNENSNRQPRFGSQGHRPPRPQPGRLRRAPSSTTIPAANTAFNQQANATLQASRAVTPGTHRSRTVHSQAASASMPTSSFGDNTKRESTLKAEPHSVHRLRTRTLMEAAAHGSQMQDLLAGCRRSYTIGK